MKNILSLLVVLFCTTCYYSCTKDKAAKPADIACAGIDSLNTYNLRIKDILDGNCAYVGCHNNTNPNIPASDGFALNTYAVAKAGFETTSSLCAIKQEGGCLPMPQGGDKLADSLITYIQCWTENGYPE
jgi:hypothetical protein